MANYITFNNAFQNLGLEFDAAQWSLDELNSLLNGDLSGVEAPELQNLIDLAQNLGCKADDIVLSTYENKKDKSVRFSVPHVQLNKDGQLAIFIGSGLNFPLTYVEKTKSAPYSYAVKLTDEIGENGEAQERFLNFKVEPYRKGQNRGEPGGEIVALNMVANVTKETAGYEEDFILSLGVYCKSGIEFTSIISDLQKGQTVPENSLVQIGVGGGFQKALKPWMLDKGFYRVMSAESKNITLKNGDNSTIYEGNVSPVVDGVVNEEESYFVSMGGAPFSPMLVNGAIAGKGVYFAIGAAYRYGVYTATIGFASILKEESPGLLSQTKDSNGKTSWMKFEAIAKRDMIAAQRNKSRDLLKDNEIKEKTEAWMNPSSAIEEEPKELALAGASSNGKAPHLDEIPF